MSAPTIGWSDVVALAPELADLSPAGQDLILAQVAEEVSTTKFGSQERADIAAGWLARHLGTLAKKGGGAGGQLQSVRVGEVSKTFAVQAAGSSWSEELARTWYGQQYLRCVRLWCPRFAST